MNTCTCTPISARITLQCEDCARREFAQALEAFAAATTKAAKALTRV